MSERYIKMTTSELKDYQKELKEALIRNFNFAKHQEIKVRKNDVVLGFYWQMGGERATIFVPYAAEEFDPDTGWSRRVPVYEQVFRIEKKLLAEIFMGPDFKE